MFIYLHCSYISIRKYVATPCAEEPRRKFILSSGDNESFRAKSRRKIDVAREKFRHAGPSRETDRVFSSFSFFFFCALNLNVTRAKPPHASSRVPRVDRNEPWLTCRFSPVCALVFLRILFIVQPISRDERINRPCLLPAENNRNEISVDGGFHWKYY